ncbi:Sjogren's syndrome/scleroderma autoantigen 1 family protein [Halorussus marinus]|uniref:Sjogren's syndrome/scleroderma autoantigen 1 family protein n=1 Tax=Halorussus marinus TaxID=2505976 RepID=UPI001091C55F|nr:Sjogren's syndrome/scleroderma autoantigen 1 family protein [Halorussus marinus]
MSTDDGDDDGFDKEAEREKLREKYGKDKQDRESTQRMSELLLQGATMTGKHCNNCGDPIFRSDGQEFCPTCQHEGQQARNADETERPAGADRADAPGPDAGEVASGSAGDPSAQSGDGEPRVEIDDVRVPDAHADRSELRTPPSQRDRDAGARAPERDRDRARGSGRGAGDRAQGRESTRDATASAGGIDAARASLVRTLNDLARRAEDADDVARTRDLLGASREAAEALAALDRASR